MRSGLAWVALSAVSMAAGWVLCTVVLMQDCETLGAFRVGSEAYTCSRR